jgi:hypothetical protein
MHECRMAGELFSAKLCFGISGDVSTVDVRLPNAGIIRCLSVEEFMRTLSDAVRRVHWLFRRIHHKA